MSLNKIGESKKQKRLHVGIKFRFPVNFQRRNAGRCCLGLEEIRLTEQGLSGCRDSG